MGFAKISGFGSGFLLCLFFVTGCNDKPASTGSAPKLAAERAEISPPQKDGKQRVASIVFVGQKEACECTRDRIKGSWQVLQDVMAGGHAVPVKRIQMDVNAQETKKLTDKKPFMVAPGIYFLDSAGDIVAMLQGEVREDEVAASLL